MISPGFAGLPPHGRGQRIGLLGGSFNPPHEGHRAASLLALRRLQLDKVWWLVTPGNPLKDTRELAPLARRMAAAQRIAAHPRIAVSAYEERLGSRYTCDVVGDLTRRAPSVRFVWLMGADALTELHLWKRWRSIAADVPLAIVDRPGSTLRAAHARAAIALANFRLDESAAALLAGARPPAFVFLHDRRSTQSSTAIRAAGGGILSGVKP